MNTLSNKTIQQMETNSDKQNDINLSTLPKEIQIHIFSFLSPKSLSKLSQVSRQFNFLTSESYFKFSENKKAFFDLAKNRYEFRQFEKEPNKKMFLDQVDNFIYECYTSTVKARVEKLTLLNGHEAMLKKLIKKLPIKETRDILSDCVPSLILHYGGLKIFKGYASISTQAVFNFLIHILEMGVNLHQPYIASIHMAGTYKLNEINNKTALQLATLLSDQHPELFSLITSYDEFYKREKTGFAK